MRPYFRCALILVPVSVELILMDKISRAYAKGHWPDEQPPDEWAVDGQPPLSQGEFLPEPALNTDNCFAVFFEPHLVHFGGDSDRVRARCSKA